MSLKDRVGAIEKVKFELAEVGAQIAQTELRICMLLGDLASNDSLPNDIRINAAERLRSLLEDLAEAPPHLKEIEP